MLGQFVPDKRGDSRGCTACGLAQAATVSERAVTPAGSQGGVASSESWARLRASGQRNSRFPAEVAPLDDPAPWAAACPWMLAPCI
jgi:hypothetical protein